MQEKTEGARSGKVEVLYRLRARRRQRSRPARVN